MPRTGTWLAIKIRNGQLAKYAHRIQSTDWQRWQSGFRKTNTFLQQIADLGLTSEYENCKIMPVCLTFTWRFGGKDSPCYNVGLFILKAKQVSIAMDVT